MKKVDKILNLYKNLSENEKISLFLTLSKLDMKRYYDPSYKKYRAIVKNIYGTHLMDKTLPGEYFNERENT